MTKSLSDKTLHSHRESPIGLLDSGVGGLTVLQAIREELPYENLLYYADTANCPYGDKAAEEILQRSQEIATFLLGKGIKLLVLACNTASSHALEVLQKTLPIPVIGMLLPAVEKTALVAPEGNVAILATKGTITAGLYEKFLKTELPRVDLFPLACPLLVPLIEKGEIDLPLQEKIIQEQLQPLQGKKISAALLACTHYPLIRPLIQKILGSDVILIDPANKCAEKVAQLLKQKGLEHPATSSPYCKFFVSQAPERFLSLVRTCYNIPIGQIELATN